MLALADSSGNVKVRDVIRKVNIKQYRKHKDPVHVVRFMSGDTKIVSGGDDYVRNLLISIFILFYYLC